LKPSVPIEHRTISGGYVVSLIRHLVPKHHIDMDPAAGSGTGRCLSGALTW